jgi:hypothetical protein
MMKALLEIKVSASTTAEVMNWVWSGTMNADDEINMDQWNAENLPGELSAANVPEKFRHLVRLAEQWGISDEVARGEVLDRASVEALEELVDRVAPLHGALDEWLAGSATSQHPLSREYLAFTHLRLAADSAKLRSARRSLPQAGRPAARKKR